MERLVKQPLYEYHSIFETSANSSSETTRKVRVFQQHLTNIWEVVASLKHDEQSPLALIEQLFKVMQDNYTELLKALSDLTDKTEWKAKILRGTVIPLQEAGGVNPLDAGQLQRVNDYKREWTQIVGVTKSIQKDQISFKDLSILTKELDKTMKRIYGRLQSVMKRISE